MKKLFLTPRGRFTLLSQTIGTVLFSLFLGWISQKTGGGFAGVFAISSITLSIVLALEADDKLRTYRARLERKGEYWDD